MSCQYNLLFLFLCGFAALSDSTETCAKDLLVGTSCILKLTTRNKERPPEIRWVHDTHGRILRWKGGTIRDKSEGLSMEEDGSLRFTSVSLKDTGKYTFSAFNADGADIGRGEVDIKVYEKAPKPTVNIKCTNDGNAILSCDIGDRKDLTLSWYKEDKIIQNEKNPQMSLSSTEVQEDKPYSCEAHNPVSKDRSESITVSSHSVKLTDNDYLVHGKRWILCPTPTPNTFPIIRTGKEEKKVGDEVSFRPITSIVWKHRSRSDNIVKVIEWDDNGVRIPNPRFKDITTLDTKTGQITITELTVEHSGVYTIDINGKELERRFTLSVMEPVPKPDESAVNPNLVYLRCENSDKIIGKDSTTEERKCSAFRLKGESITVKDEVNPESVYTCTLDNSASKETSDPV